MPGSPSSSVPPGCDARGMSLTVAPERVVESGSPTTKLGSIGTGPSFSVYERAPSLVSPAGGSFVPPADRQICFVAGAESLPASLAVNWMSLVADELLVDRLR